MYRIQVLKGKKGYWYWRIKHSNGRIVLTSETYRAKKSAHDSAVNLWSQFKPGACTYEEEVKDGRRTG